MQALWALLACAATLLLVLYMNQPEAPSQVAEVLGDGMAVWNPPPKCAIHNLETLRKSAIVYTWVNGTERCYNARRKRAGLTPGGSSRDKEMGELKYSLRSLFKFAPWLEGPIYIVTPGQIPSWLDTTNPRIHVIDQDDLLPEDTSVVKRPNFDTNVLEQYLYKIPGLTDVFIHMNDDYLFVKPVSPHRFFTCDGGIRFLTEINHIRHVPGTESNAWLASVRNTVKLMDQHYGGEHVYNFNKHAPFVYSRRAFEEIHRLFGKELDATGQHQVRHYRDLNVPLLHHIYMNEEGSKSLRIPIEFNPLAECDEWLLVRLTDSDHESIKKKFDAVLTGRSPEVLLALNDEYSMDDTAALVQSFYTKLLPDRQFYELPEGKSAPFLSNYIGPDCKYDRDVIPAPISSSSSLRHSLSRRGAMPPGDLPPQALYFRSTPSAFIGATFVAYALGMLASLVLVVCVLRFVNVGGRKGHSRAGKTT